MHIIEVDKNAAELWQKDVGTKIAVGFYLHAPGRLIGPYPTRKHLELTPYQLCGVIWGDRPCRNLENWSYRE